MRRAALLLAGVLALAGCGADRGASPTGPVTVPLEDSAGLGVAGEVTLASAGAGRTDVAVELEGPETVAFSASIRAGTCAGPGEVVHDLGVVETGSTSLTAESSLDDLLSRESAFVLTADEGGAVACADLPERAG